MDLWRVAGERERSWVSKSVLGVEFASRWYPEISGGEGGGVDFREKGGAGREDPKSDILGPEIPVKCAEMPPNPPGAN